MLSDTTIYIVFFSCIINSNTFFCRSGLSFTDLYGNYNYQKSFYTQLCDKTTPACDDYKRSKYRSANGVCNNLKNPTWGVALHEHARYLPAVYDDGIYIEYHKIDFSMLLFWAQKAKTSTIYKSVILKFDKYVLVTFTTVLQEQQYRKLLIHNIIDYNNNNYSSIITFRESFISQNITSSIYCSVLFDSICSMYHEIQIHEKPRFIQISIVHKYHNSRIQHTSPDK